ncbi:MAG: type III pantothenate kinase [Candidatus Omnitrophica bacterium]|nr:type III pantothenate kinase [Candidatus Omnitrophota bacterium]
MIFVDIGNTTVHFSIRKNGREIKNFRIPIHKFNKKILKEILIRFSPSKIIICSVVPNLTKFFKKVCKSREVIVIGEDVKVPIPSLYNPKEVGNDRLLCVFAAKKIFGKAKLVIDFGTAITFDFISSKGEYLGGFIFPGIELAYKSLRSCALLGKKIKVNPQVSGKIPKGTSQSINKGIIEGFALLINSWVEKYRRWIAKSGKINRDNIIITGGGAKLILKKLNFPYIYEPNLIFKGMRILFSL